MLRQYSVCHGNHPSTCRKRRTKRLSSDRRGVQVWLAPCRVRAVDEGRVAQRDSSLIWDVLMVTNHCGTTICLVI